MFERIRMARMIARDIDRNPENWMFAGNNEVTNGAVQVRFDDYYRTVHVMNPIRVSVCRGIVRRAIRRLQERHLRIALKQ